jgi:TonB family protein
VNPLKGTNNMPLPRLFLILIVVSSSVCLASVPAGWSAQRRSLDSYEQQVWTSPAHDSEFATVPHTSQASCAATQPPQALATPNPLIDEATDDGKITVSFIIGTDGKVHSPFILESAGASEDNTVLNTIRAWRYRPAMCNGVPTESEAKIGFSPR